MLKLKLQYFSHLLWRADALWRHWCWERLKAGREGNNRGWDGWMASLTQWIWVWVNSGSWWRTGSPGVLQSMGSQRVRHDWVTELNWTGLNSGKRKFIEKILLIKLLLSWRYKNVIKLKNASIISLNYGQNTFFNHHKAD